MSTILAFEIIERLLKDYQEKSATFLKVYNFSKILSKGIFEVDDQSPEFLPN